MSQFIIQWIDFIWLPLTYAVVPKHHRYLALGFVLCCIFSLRLENELFERMGYPEGITGWISMTSYARGLIIYSVAIMGFLMLSHFSPRTHGIIYMAAALSIYITTFLISITVMAI